MFIGLLCRHSLDWVLLEELRDEVFQLPVVNFLNVIIAFDYFLDCLFSLRMIERRLACIKLIGNAPDGPHVYWCPMDLM